MKSSYPADTNHTEGSDDTDHSLLILSFWSFIGAVKQTLISDWDGSELQVNKERVFLSQIMQFMLTSQIKQRNVFVY